MMTYILIGLVLLFVVVPIISILPNEEQRALMKMRKIAMGRGIGVELTTIPDHAAQVGKRVSGSGRPMRPVLKVAAYRRYRKRPQSRHDLPAISWSVFKGPKGDDALPGNWQWQEQPAVQNSRSMKLFLAEKLEHLPESVVSVTEKNRAVSVHWVESGDTSQAEIIFSFLDDCINWPDG